jgi:hypothetical protein
MTSCPGDMTYIPELGSLIAILVMLLRDLPSTDPRVGPKGGKLMLCSQAMLALPP